MFAAVTCLVACSYGAVAPVDAWVGEVSDVGWAEVAPEHRPSARGGAAMAFLPMTDQLVLYGGGGPFSYSNATNDTWLWDGTDWTVANPRHSPPVALDVGMAFDRANGSLLLFITGTSAGSETWSWNGSDWTQRQPVHAPSPRTDYIMAEGPGNTVVLHGGWALGAANPTPLNDTWVWNGTDWIEKTVTPPSQSYGPMLGFDAFANETVLLTGDRAGPPETWVWNGTSWTKESPAHLPPPRYRGAMAFAEYDGLVLFGGHTDENCRTDTWSWTGSDWRPIDPSTSPPCRAVPGMAYDERFGEIVLFGGGARDGTPLDDTWLSTAETRWESLGGVLVGGPAASTWGSGRLDIAVRGTDNQLWHKWFDGGWHNWEALGGVLTDDPGAASWSPGRYDVFVRGTDNALWHRWYDGRWHDWESLGGVLASGPGVVAWGPNRLDVFVRGTDNAMWHRWWDGVGWRGWESLGGVLRSKPAAVSGGPGDLRVYVEGSNQHYYSRSHNGGWYPWSEVAPIVWMTAPGAARGGYVFGVDDGQVWQSDGHGWQSLGGSPTSAPAAATWGSPRMDVFVRGGGGELSHAWSRRVPPW